MVNEFLGASMELDEDWDLVIDGSGDISTVEGIDELAKDIAYSLTLVLGDVSAPLDIETRSRIRDLAIDVFAEESRVLDVQNIDVSEADLSAEEDIKLQATLTVIGDETEEVEVEI